MKYRTLGRTGLQVSEIGFGGGGIGYVWGATTDAEAIRAVHRALDLGVNFYDVAPAYGDGKAEDLLGRALAGRRDKVFVATKVALPPERLDDIVAGVDDSFHQSLRRLRTDCVDLLQVHNGVSSRRNMPFRGCLPAHDILRVAEVFQGLRRAGKVRYIGFTAWRGNRSELHKLLDSGIFDTLQTEYNILNQSAVAPPPPGVDIEEAADFEARGELPQLTLRYRPVSQSEIIPLAVARGIGVICIRPLLAGALSEGLDRPIEPGRYMEKILERARSLRFLAADGRRTLSQVALIFCLMNPHISTVIPGVKNAAEIEEAAACSGAPPLSAEEMRRIDELYRTNFGVP